MTWTLGKVKSGGMYTKKYTYEHAMKNPINPADAYCDDECGIPGWIIRNLIYSTQANCFVSNRTLNKIGKMAFIKFFGGIDKVEFKSLENGVIIKAI